MKIKGIALAGSLLALSAAASDDTQGRIRHTEGGATLQRSSEPGADEAIRNLPFLPGDRVWTDETGRIEFQFGGGSLVRLDARSKLDFMAAEDERGRGRVVLRLWSGALYVHVRDERGAPDFEIETPAGLVQTNGTAVARIDLAFGETRLSVHEGRASFDNGVRSVRVEAGETTLARRGEDPTRPQRIDRRDGDEFARWDEARERQADWASDEARYLPAEVAPFADDLRGNGSWHLETDIGYVWQPRVSAGWRPYQNGRWTWSQYGWTWVPNESWGWAPSHYGRWGHSASLGWYWIPGSTWGPAWVTWSVGNDYVGWSPMGWRDRQVTVAPRNLGHAVERGSAWTYARRSDMAARDLARRRVELSEPETRSLRVVEPKTGHVDRSVRVVDGAQPRGESAAPRNVQIRPTPGDTIPELRSDPATTIPFPMVRRKYPSEDERREREGKDRAQTQRTRFGESPTAAAESPAPEKSRPADNPSAVRSSPRERTKEPEDQDRDVLRRMFTPLSRTREKEQESRPSPSNEGAAARTRPRETSRETPPPPPPKAEPRPTPSPRAESEGAVRRKREK